MKAADVMVRNVITVGPDACVQDVAHILLTARISGVPVVGSNGELVGIVSEGDLMRRVEAGTGRRRPWWLAIFTGKEGLAMEFIREHSRKVADVMTRHVITAAPDTPLWKIANLLEKNAIKRVPIVEDGKVVGIVSRANLLQALASLSKRAEVATGTDDSQIRDKVLSQLMDVALVDQRDRAGRHGRAVGDRGLSVGEESRPHRRRGHPRGARRQ
jgi:CBS domain-containing protein